MRDTSLVRERHADRIAVHVLPDGHGAGARSVFPTTIGDRTGDSRRSPRRGHPRATDSSDALAASLRGRPA